jgi:WD40 repeat protein
VGPGGDRIAAGLGDPSAARAVAVWDTRTGRQLRVLNYPQPAWLTFTPDGGRLLGLDRWSFVEVPLPDGEPRRTSARGLHSAALSPDGARLAALGPDGALIEWSTSPAVLLREVAPPGGRPLSVPAYGPDGRLFLACDVGGAALVELPHGLRVARLPLTRIWLQGLAVSPHGALVLARATDRLCVWAWPNDPDGPARVAADWSEAPAFAGWLPDGRLLTVCGQDGAVRIWPAELLRA